MTTAKLQNYGANIKRISDANAREEQRNAIRRTRFKASLVDDPLHPTDDIVRAIENSRKTDKT